MSPTKRKGSRRKAREIALSCLYMLEMQTRFAEVDSFEQIVNDFLSENKSLVASVEKYARVLINGVVKHLNEIDKKIEDVSVNWKLSRINRIDRNILRVAVFEMLFCDDVPPQVAIDEAIEIAKKFGCEESSAFINGILDQINKRHSEKSG